MKYNPEKILADLDGIGAPLWIKKSIEDLARLPNRLSNDQGIALCLGFIVRSIYEVTSDAENSPLSNRDKEQVEALTESSRYLKGVLSE